MCSDHAAALKCYVMAGAIDSLFFEKDVSACLWSQQVCSFLELRNYMDLILFVWMYKEMQNTVKPV